MATTATAAPTVYQSINWGALIANIATSSLLNVRPGTTIEQDIQALIDFFNKTAAESQDPSNPYRGAFAQISEWRQQDGWSSIVSAHSNVAVRCKTLYMDGAEEFVKKHCYWNIQSKESSGTREFVYPSPQWTIVEDCCEKLERPVLRVHDAVWATTRGEYCRDSLPSRCCFADQGPWVGAAAPA
eukprot:2755906-Prymnesium_polylepis.1